MLAFGLSLGLSNAGLLPLTHAFYELCARSALPMAVALGLLSAGPPAGAATGGVAEDDSGKPLQAMLLAFVIGAAGTLLGALAAFWVSLRASLLSQSAAACAAGLMCATYVRRACRCVGT